MNNYLKKEAIINDISESKDHLRISVNINNENEFLIVNNEVRIFEDEGFNQVSVDDLKVGDKVSIYVSSNTPVMLSYPPQYKPALLVVNKSEEYTEHKLDHFNEELISSDNMVKINESSLNLIESVYNDSIISDLLKDQLLLVFYAQATRSIPALVSVKKVIIL